MRLLAGGYSLVSSSTLSGIALSNEISRKRSKAHMSIVESAILREPTWP